jgi:hypothetical protein
MIIHSYSYYSYYSYYYHQVEKIEEDCDRDFFMTPEEAKVTLTLTLTLTASLPACCSLPRSG